MTILITGVCGRIGSSLAKMLASHYQVIGMDVCESFNQEISIDYIFTNLCIKENVMDSLSDVRRKYGNRMLSVIHLAAYYNFTGGKWEQYESITIGGTRNLLDALVEFEVEQFIFSSTMLVYAPCKLGEKIKEDSPLDPKWEYPLSKVKTEELLCDHPLKTKKIILRISGVYDNTCHSIPLSRQIDRIYKNHLESHFFPGNLNHGSSFLHMEDLVQLIKNVIEKRRELSDEEIFVLGEPNVVSYKELQHELGHLIHGKKWLTLRIPKWVAKLGTYAREKLPFLKKTFVKSWMIDLADDHYDLDISKAKRELDWEPVHKLRNCLPKMVDALKKDPKKWYKEHNL